MTPLPSLQQEIGSSSQNPPTAGRVDWRAVIVFYVLACAISWPFFWWRDIHPASWARFETLGFLKGWLPALGPSIGAAIALPLLPRPLPFSLWGTSLWRSLLFAGVPLAMLTLIGVGSDHPHLTGLVFGLAYMVYALGEEIGWRGFLQTALSPLPPFHRYVLIGVLWGVWHSTTFWGGGFAHAFSRQLWMYPMFIGASWGIGVTVNKTRSLLSAVCLHLIFNFRNGLPPTTTLWVLGVSAIVWFVLIKTWRSEEK